MQMQQEHGNQSFSSVNDTDDIDSRLYTGNSSFMSGQDQAGKKLVAGFDPNLLNDDDLDFERALYQLQAEIAHPNKKTTLNHHIFRTFLIDSADVKSLPDDDITSPFSDNATEIDVKSH